ncbi:hypothetical protein GCAAIG_13495 [Candidatus Electronema halotolerans]
MESIITYGIIYLLIFRLAVLVLGGLSIFYGYRLFLSNGQQAGQTADQGGELHGKINSSELTIKSTAPGIFFSAFGAAIVIAVLAGSQPDVTYNEKQHSPQTGETVQESSISLRSLPPSSAVSADAGTASYSRVVRDLPQAIDELKTAVSLAPDNPDYRDLLARLLFAWGEPDKAAAEQRRAVDKVDAARKADFRARLDLYEQAARAGA